MPDKDGDAAAEQTPKASVAETPPAKPEGNEVADELRRAAMPQTGLGAALPREERDALAGAQHAEAQRVAAAQGDQTQTGNGGLPGGTLNVPSPQHLVPMVQIQPVRVARATGVWVSNNVGPASLIENVNDFPNMPEWVRSDGAKKFDGGY